MNKKEVIQQLKSLKNIGDMAEIICDVNDKETNQVAYKNESIIVLLSKCNSDQIIDDKHWNICNSVNDFNKNTPYGIDEGKKSVGRFYISDFKEVKPFISDFK